MSDGADRERLDGRADIEEWSAVAIALRAAAWEARRVYNRLTVEHRALDQALRAAVVQQHPEYLAARAAVERIRDRLERARAARSAERTRQIDELTLATRAVTEQSQRTNDGHEARLARIERMLGLGVDRTDGMS